jgi:hypothetical protein
MTGLRYQRSRRRPRKHPRYAVAMLRHGTREEAFPAWLGPLLVAATVLFALRGFVFASQLTNEHPDLLSFWLPRWSYLGREIADLSLPAWNPYEMLGYRFAADPQGGWLYASPMLFFSVLSPGVAMRAMLVLHPLLAGVGLYAFLRVERLGRLAATLASVSLAAMMSTSELVLSMPFAGTVAWTTVVLLSAAAFRRAERASSRIAWLALGAFGWSQVASAHLSHGLVMCSLVVAAFLVGHLVVDAREGVRPWRSAAVPALTFLAVLPLASLAVLVPRFDAIASSSLQEGYSALEAGTGERVRVGDSAIQSDGVWAAWPLASSSAPGAYAGAAVLLAAPLALRSRRFRGLVWGVGAASAITYSMTLTGVVTGPIGDVLERLPFGDTLVHNPGRLRILWLIVLPVLAAAGVQGLRDEPLPIRRLAWWLGASAAVWLVVPLAARGSPLHWVLFAVAAVPAAVALVTWTRSGPAAPAMLVGLLLVEVLASSVASSRYEGYTQLIGLEGDSTSPNAVLQPLRTPDVDLDAFLEPGPFVEIIGDARYLTWAPPAASYQRGYLAAQEPSDWPALALERGTLFGIRDVLGYNPVELQRYWSWIRAVNELPLFYNATSLQLPTARDVDMAAVRFLVVPEGVASPLDGDIVATDRGYDLVELDAPSPLVSVVPRWTVVPDADAAFDAVTDPSFRVDSTAILERDPGIAPDDGATAEQAGATTEPAAATVAEVSDTDLRIDVDAPAASIVVIRASYDDGWRATVDGEPATVLPVDGFLQGVAVTAGSHEIRLTYRDDAVAAGMWLSALVWSVLAAAWILARARERTRPRAGDEGRAASPGEVVPAEV